MKWILTPTKLQYRNLLYYNKKDLFKTIKQNDIVGSFLDYNYLVPLSFELIVFWCIYNVWWKH